jgi:hypothetical protein
MTPGTILLVAAAAGAGRDVGESPPPRFPGTPDG